MSSKQVERFSFVLIWSVFNQNQLLSDKFIPWVLSHLYHLWQVTLCESASHLKCSLSVEIFGAFNYIVKYTHSCLLLLVSGHWPNTDKVLLNILQWWLETVYHCRVAKILPYVIWSLDLVVLQSECSLYAKCIKMMQQERKFCLSSLMLVDFFKSQW